MKKKWLLFLFTLILFTGCTSLKTATNESEENTPNLIVGFSQSGTESSWRKRHSKSIIDELEKKEYQIFYKNGFLNQEQQIQDVRTFIAYKVDIIVLSPLTEIGWEKVLQEAKDADIKVILVDRTVNVSDASLFLTHIGSSFKSQGNKAGLYLYNYFKEKANNEIKIIEVTGLKDASPTIGRSQGFSEVITRFNRDFPSKKMTIYESLTGDFIRQKGKEVLIDFKKRESLETIDVIFSHNDEMTLGILEALELTTLIPGQTPLIITVDAQAEMIALLRQGTVNSVIECKPDMGWLVANSIERYFNGIELSSEIYISETVFSDQGDLNKIPTRNY